MNTVANIKEKQQVATGRDREAALGVIMPRVMGALKSEGRVVRDHEGKQSLEVRRGNFWIGLVPFDHYIFFSIYHRHHGYVLSGRVYSDGSGDRLDGRMSAVRWDRSADHRGWQAELFETFDRDDDWLLAIPQKAVRPEIVTAVLSHMAA